MVLELDLQHEGPFIMVQTAKRISCLRHRLHRFHRLPQRHQFHRSHQLHRLLEGYYEESR